MKGRMRRKAATALLAISPLLSSCKSRNPPCQIGEYHFSSCPCEAEELTNPASSCVSLFKAQKKQR